MFLSQAEWEWLDPNQHDEPYVEPVFLSLVRPKTDIQLLQKQSRIFSFALSRNGISNRAVEFYASSYKYKYMVA